MASADRNLGLISSEHIVGATVYDSQGKEIGEIDHLMIDPETGRARYAVVNFCGFMCLRPGHHAVPWNALCYDEDKRRYTSDVTAEQLEKAPEFDADSWKDREWETRIHAHYGASPYWETAQR
ncbi:PRC-barrel domain-containing protein [Methylosinus sp. Sm6]|uniref:PRC-barrel domain-containing protein n=1 Tax=Methylosinus sp. Sm6 TaxID=2866948 RepID=UPI001C98FBA2|nr:PRC-barrel domain-containing protein [Methylosinus sp. Sm6]MBY6242529.1 PRC-barrel domain-containing protein [Methylosinus sp. Sm6]